VALIRLAWVSVALIALGTRSAHADAREAVRPAVEYFRGEFVQGFAWTGVGLASIGGGVVLVTRDDDFARGAGYPMIGVGAIQLIAGVVSFISPPLRAARAASAVREGRGEAVIAGERKRIRRVNRGFRVLEMTELALLFGGGATAGIAYVYDRPTLTGVGLGIAVEATAMFVLDWFAHRRAVRYQHALEQVEWR
jgi:hypothetical protein